MEESLPVRLLKHRCNNPVYMGEAFRESRYSGIEVDVVQSPEDYGLKLWHDHCPPSIAVGLDLALHLCPADKTIAINVKEYKLAGELHALLMRYGFLNTDRYFIFDVPGPELEEYNELGLRVFGRISEYEEQYAEGVVIDSFTQDLDFVRGEIDSAVHNMQDIALISPTLRGGPEWDYQDLTLQKALYVITK
jgi:hypothetical protein